MDEKIGTQIAYSLARIATELNQISTMMQRQREKRRTEAVIFVPVLTAALILVWQLVKAGHRQL